VWSRAGDLAIAAPQEPVLVNIIEVVTLHDGRAILPSRPHLALPAAPLGDSQISRLERALDDLPSVPVKPFFDLMRCHPHDPISFLQEPILGRANPLTLRPVKANKLYLNQREIDREGTESRMESFFPRGASVSSLAGNRKIV
jgi:hypothetical protein